MKNSFNAVIGSVRMLFRLRALKPQNSKTRIQLRMMCTSFNGNHSTTIVFCYSHTNANDEMYIITFHNELSSLVRYISIHNVLIITGDMYTYISNDGNNEFYLRDSLKRNSEYLTDFYLKNRLTCLNSRFPKRK